MKLNPVQEALIVHFKRSECPQEVNETEDSPEVAQELRKENEALKARIEYLEQQITTNAFGGWQIH